MTTLKQVERWENELKGWGTNVQPSNLMPSPTTEEQQPNPVVEQGISTPEPELVKQETPFEKVSRWERGEPLSLIDKALQEGDTRKAEILTDWEKGIKDIVGDEKEEPFKFTTTEPLRSVTHKGYEEKPEELPESQFGVLGDIGSGIASGIVQLTEMAHRTARAFDAPGGIDVVRDFTTNQIAYLNNLQKEYPRVFQPSKQTQRNVVRNAIYGGFSAIIPSVGAGALGLALAPAAPIAAFALGAGGIFATSEFDTYIEDAQKKGKTYNESLPYAIASGIVEGGGEAIADLIGGKLLGLNKAALLPFKNSVKGMLHKNIARLFGTLVKPMPIEVGTEIGQESGETWIRNLQGISDEDPLKQGMQAIGPSIVMTLLFGAGGAYHNKQQRKALEKVLVDKEVSPEQRMQAVKVISESIKRKDSDLAENWEATAKMYIDNQMAIPIDIEISDFIANKGQIKGRITQRGKKPKEDIDKTIEALKKDYQAGTITDANLDAIKAVASPGLLKRWDEITAKPKVVKEPVDKTKAKIKKLENRITETVKTLNKANKEEDSDQKAKTISHLNNRIKGMQAKLGEYQKEAGLTVEEFIPKQKAEKALEDVEETPVEPKKGDIQPQIEEEEEEAISTPAPDIEEAPVTPEKGIEGDKEIKPVGIFEEGTKIPEQGRNVSAIELDDGTIYYDTKAVIHSDMLKNNPDIPVDRVVDGGFIVDGKYVRGSADAASIGRQAKAKKIVANRIIKDEKESQPQKVTGKFALSDNHIVEEGTKLGEEDTMFIQTADGTVYESSKIGSPTHGHIMLNFPELEGKEVIGRGMRNDKGEVTWIEGGPEKEKVKPKKDLPKAVEAQHKKQAKKLGIDFIGMQDVKGKPSFPMFDDPKTKDFFSVKEGQTVEGELKKVRDKFKKAEEAKKAKAKEPEFPTYTDKQLKGIKVEVTALDGKTGEKVTVPEDAAKALDEAKKDVTEYQKILDCLTGKS